MWPAHNCGVCAGNSLTCVMSVKGLDANQHVNFPSLVHINCILVQNAGGTCGCTVAYGQIWITLVVMQL